MAKVSDVALDRALLAAFTGTLSVGLFAGDTEETDAGYQRRPVALRGPQEDADGARVMVNAADIVFPPYAQSATAPIDGWVLFDGDVELCRGSMLEPRQQRDGDQCVIRAGLLHAGFRGS
jgi:hypothetical protein